MVVKANLKMAADSTAAKGSPPQSKFSPKYKGKAGLVDQGPKNRLHIEAFQGGILFGYIDSGNPVTQGYTRPHLEKLIAEQDTCNEINVNRVAYRRGIDGNTFMPSKPHSPFGWQGLLSIIGEENIHNDKYKLEEFVVPVLHYFNKFDNFGYSYPRGTKYLMDHTPKAPLPARKVSSVLLDETVMELMMAAYGDGDNSVTLGSLAEFDEIVGMYWNDVEYGKSVMHLASLTNVATSGIDNDVA
jgi:hypothetical protein